MERDSIFSKTFGQRNSFIFETHVYSRATYGGVYNFNNIRTWLEKIPKDFFQFRLIFIPININNKHWTLVVCDVECQSFFYCDSLNAHA